MTNFTFFVVDIGKEFGSGHFVRSSLIYAQWPGRQKCFLVLEDHLSFLRQVHPKIELLKSFDAPLNDSESIGILPITSVNQISQVFAEAQKKYQLQLVLDSYTASADLEKQWSQYLSRLVVIDDLANREHFCDILIDVTLNRTAVHYHGLVPEHCKLLLGPKFCFIKEIIRKRREHLPFHSVQQVQKMHIFMGGYDENDLTRKYLTYFYKNFPDLQFNVVVSGAYPFLQTLLQEFSKDPRVTIFDNVEDMGQTLEDCQIAFGAPGITTWERACLGVVGFYISTNINQEPILTALAQNRFCYYFGYWKNLSEETLTENFQKALQDLPMLNFIRENALALIDGQGVHRIIKELN